MKKELEQHIDDRGVLVECFDGVFYATIRPEQVRGNHYHKRKGEKFVVIKGKVVVKLRSLDGTLHECFMMNGDHPEELVVGPNVVHSFTGYDDEEEEAILLVQPSEKFDPNDPDTFYEEA